jgi:hypothetical protein
MEKEQENSSIATQQEDTVFDPSNEQSPLYLKMWQI